MSWPKFWEKKQWQSIALLPLAKLVCWEAARRLKKFESSSTNKPTQAVVVVVGNIVVGGTGKTPFIIWLAKQLQQRNLKVGIISRGYGAKQQNWPHLVTDQSQAAECGDEPLMLAKQTGCPVAVSPKRIEAIELLASKTQCDVIISDDGLQHYAMARDIEIVLIDAQRRFGNGFCMPSGPLREPLDRIQKVDFTVWNGLDLHDAIPTLSLVQKNPSRMQLKPHTFRLVGEPNTELSVHDFLKKYSNLNVYAIAGIGNPQRFFTTLTSMGLKVDSTAFKDHFSYQKEDIQNIVNASLNKPNNAIEQKPLIMTEKDAVKCTQFAKTQKHWWYLQVQSECDGAMVEAVVDKVRNSVS
ncbi:tetraacyldisaccharide 4'-kinase [Thiomicrorhabdus hydrogeniphila]